MYVVPQAGPDELRIYQAWKGSNKFFLQGMFIFGPDFGVVHISTGDVLRAEVSASTDTGNKAKDNLSAEKNNWRGIPTRLHNIPHSREIGICFYEDVMQATKRAIQDGKTRFKVSEREYLILVKKCKYFVCHNL